MLDPDDHDVERLSPPQLLDGARDAAIGGRQRARFRETSEGGRAAAEARRVDPHVLVRRPVGELDEDADGVRLVRGAVRLWMNAPAISTSSILISKSPAAPEVAVRSGPRTSSPRPCLGARRSL